jgi:hypothetical protein
MTTTLASALEASILEHEYRVHGGPRREAPRRRTTKRRSGCCVSSRRHRAVFDRYNICDEQDDPHVAELLTGRLDVAVAVATGESKSTTERTTAENLRCVLSKRGAKCVALLVDDTGLEPVTSGM